MLEPCEGYNLVLVSMCSVVIAHQDLSIIPGGSQFKFHQSILVPTGLQISWQVAASLWSLFCQRFAARRCRSLGHLQVFCRGSGTWSTHRYRSCWGSKTAWIFHWVSCWTEVLHLKLGLLFGLNNRFVMSYSYDSWTAGPLMSHSHSQNIRRPI